MTRVALSVLLVSLAVVAPARASELISIATPSVHVDPSRTVFNGEPPKELRANVLLPDGYTPARRWPVVYLLHGVGDTHQTWARPERGDIANIAKGLPAIIVMPEAGRGFYTNWFNGGKRGDPGWERFYLDELIPIVEARLPILPGRTNHAIIGSSMGGFGAAYLGSQRPDYFGAVAAFSGFVQHQRPEVEAGLQARGGPEYQVIFGPMYAPYATGHNPTRVIANLRHSRLFLATGDGTPEPGAPSDPAAVPGGGAVEAGLRQQSDEFVAAARAERIDVTYLPQSGIHDWPYWRRHVGQAIEWGLFKPVAEDPSEWTYATIANRGRMWSLTYGFSQPPADVVQFSRAGEVLRGALVGGGSGPEVRVEEADTGCGFTAKVPFERRLPQRTCGRIELRVRPRRLPVGRSTALRITAVRVGDDASRRALAGARILFGSRRVTTNGAGRATLRVRPRPPLGVRRLRATHPGLSSATVRLRIVRR